MKKMKWYQLQGKNKHRKIQASCFFGPLGRIIWLRDRGYRLRILLLRVKMSIALFMEQSGHLVHELALQRNLGILQ